MKAGDIRVYATELSKDVLFPSRCPVCGDLIPIDRRGAHYELIRRAAARAGELRAAERMPEELLASENRIMRGAEEALPNPLGNVSDTSLLSADLLMQSYFCGGCGDSLTLIDQNRCHKCGKQLAESKSLCRDCETKIRCFTSARSLLVYDEAAQEMLTAVKYHGAREHLRGLSLLLAKRLHGWIGDLRADCMVPVPVHTKRLLQRGYNQAEVLAKDLSDVLWTVYGLELPVRADLLIRNKNTTALKSLDPAERLRSLQQAFMAAGDLSGLHRVLLIDDIYTTGSTMNTCAFVLQNAGVKEVYGLTLAAGTDQ